jgi:hypothetical protein
MERCKHAVIHDTYGHPLLEDKGQGNYKLREKEGTIVFCESNCFSEIPVLDIRLSPLEDEKINFNLRELPIPALVGQKLRIFYDLIDEEGEFDIKAYELYDDNRIRRRGALEHISFIQ